MTTTKYNKLGGSEVLEKKLEWQPFITTLTDTLSDHATTRGAATAGARILQHQVPTFYTGNCGLF